MSVLPAGARGAFREAIARRAWLPALLSVGFVLAMFAAVIALRWRWHYSNVDDYLYALQTHAYLDAVGLDPRPLAHAWKAYGSSTPLVPMLALPVAAIDSSPQGLVLVQVIPLLVVLLSIRSLLRGLGLRPLAAWAAAALITTLPPVLGYAAMYHFGLAATACTTLAAACYARSGRLRRRTPALVLGVAVGLLALARVIAPIYILALCAPLAVDVLAERRDRAARARNGALAALVAGILAAPWWLATGSTAARYLTSQGYGHGSFTRGGSRLDVAWHRLTWTASESGWLLAVVLAALLVWASACVLRHAPGWRLAAWLMASSLFGLLLLATSSNAGTAFALPFVVLLCCAAVWGIERMPSPLRAVVAVGCVASLALPALALLDLVGRANVSRRALWQAGTPGLQQARVALGCECAPPDTDVLSDRVLATVGERRVLSVRDDAVLNANSLRYRAASHGSKADIQGPAADGTTIAAQLSGVDYVLAGGTFRSYHPNVNPLAVLIRLREARFRPVLARQLSRGNSVVVWAAPARGRVRWRPSRRPAPR